MQTEIIRKENLNNHQQVGQLRACLPILLWGCGKDYPEHWYWKLYLLEGFGHMHSPAHILN